MYTKKSYKKVAFILILVLIATMVPIMSSADSVTPNSWTISSEISGGNDGYAGTITLAKSKGNLEAVFIKDATTCFIWTPELLGGTDFEKLKTYIIGIDNSLTGGERTFENIYGIGRTVDIRANKTIKVTQDDENWYIDITGSGSEGVSHLYYAYSTPPPQEVEGEVIIKKLSSTGSELANAWFTLSDEEGFTTSAATSSDGSLKFDDLKITVGSVGTKYILEETTPPAGYIGPNHSWEFNLTTANPSKSFTGDYALINTPESIEVKGLIEIEKINTNGDKLGDAWFTLSDGAGFTTSAATSSDGSLKFDNLAIAPGDDGTEYTLEETTPPAGYVNSNLFTTTFALTESSPTKSFTGTDSIMNIPEENIGSVELLKRDAGDLDKLLDGAIFSLKNTSTGAIVTAEAINGKAVWPSIPYGEYLLEEIQAALGYNLNSLILYKSDVDPLNLIDDFIITVDEEIPHYILAGTNTPTEEIYGSLSLTKLNVADISPISGAKFELFDANGDTLGEKTTGLDGVVSWGGLTIGDKYYLQETQPAPDFEGGTLRINGIVWVGTNLYEVTIGEDDPDLTLTATNEEEEVLGEEEFPSGVMGDSEDPFEQSVLGEEAKTDDTMNIMLMLFFILTAIAIAGGILAQRRMGKDR